MAEGNHQRAFARSIKAQNAQQIRQSTTAAVKVIQAEQAQNRPKLHVVDPLDYEGELSSRRKDLEKEPFLNLLLFPQQDVSVNEEERDHRTSVPIIPSEAQKQASNLFTHECLKFYTSKWHMVTYNYSQYACSAAKVLDHDYHKQLPAETFELDLIDEEKLASLSFYGGTPISRKGYLFKGPFPQDGGISVSMKSYRKRWFVLTGGPREGGYSLIFYKDEKSSNIKGKIHLDTCTEIKENNRYKQHGFDVMTEEDKVFYPLAADSEAEMEEWISILNRAIGLEVEETDKAGVNSLSSFYAKETLVKDPRKVTFYPEMLEYTSKTEAENAQRRLRDSRPLFHVCPELLQPSRFADDSKSDVAVPVEKFGQRFVVKCNDLKFKLTVDRNGEKGHIEPFFLTLAVFDANKGMRISEDFHVDLNSPFLRQLVPPLNGITEPGPHPLSEKASRATEGVFSVTFPHTEIYLVARVEKILQNGISTCAEPYIKTGDSAKATQKLAQQITSVCSRLGQYRMPFVWAVRPLFTAQEELDTESQFSPLFRQEKEKLTDEDILKILSDYRSLHKQKLHVIPGVLSVDVVQLPSEIRKATLTSSLLPLKSTSFQNGTDEVDSTLSSASPISPMLEVIEFPPLEAYHPHTSYQPHISFRHHLYVYPTSLKYDGQKAFAKARNIVCCVQFKDSDDQGSAPLGVIYSKCSSATFTDRANTTVLHHCTTPTFYDEVKLKLPIRLNTSHHLLFTFYHVACDVAKGGKSTKSSIKLPPVESAVGFAWLPLMDTTGRVLSDSHNIPVSSTLPPGYLGTKPPSSPTAHGSRGGAISPDIKWVDGHKPVFRVTTNLDSTIYTQSYELHQFFLQCQHLQSKGITSPPTMTSLLSSLKALDKLSLSSTIQFLPMLMSQLFKLLSHSSKEVENIKPDVLKMLIFLVDKVDGENGSDILSSYIEYMFVTEVDSSRKKAVHDELARLLVQYLRQQSNQGNQNVPQFLEHLWFFLEVMLKSMAQYLPLTKKTIASRKTRYPEDFGWNLQSLVSSLLLTIREMHSETSARKANKSLAEFVQRAFSFMDRGVVFKIVARYLETFTVKENIQLSSLKLDFLRIVCDHEHFIALNLPFPVTHENMEFSLSEEFSRKHFLVGVVLREVESCLEYEASAVRKKMFVILRNILAKLDCDARYADSGQKARIAALFFPLIPLVLNHVTRLNPGSATYVSPMLNAASMAFFNPNSIDIRSLPSDSIAGSVPGSAVGTLRSIAEERDRSFDKRGTTISKGSHPHIADSDQVSLDPTIVSDAASAHFITTSPTSMDQTLIEMDKISVDETRDLLMSVLFVMKHLDRAILLHWWHECMGSSNTAAALWTTFDDTYPSQFSQLMDFFDLLESCLYTFKYIGRRTIAVKISSQMSRESSIFDQQSLLQQQLVGTVPPPSGGKEKLNKKGSLPISTSSLQSLKSKSSRTTSLSVSSPSASLLPSSMPLSIPLSAIAPSEDIDSKVNVEAALANEVGLIILSLLDTFGAHFKKELCQDEGDNVLMTKYFSLLVSFLQVNQSLSLQTHLFAVLRVFVHKFKEALFKGSAEYCGILCYEILQCCNSRLPSTRTEATALLYLIMRCNFEYFNGRGFVRTHLQSTIAVSRLVSALLGQSDSNLRRSLSYIANFVSQDVKVQNTAFPTEVKDLMKRLKTVLSSTAEMKIHQNDPEKLVDLHYSLAKSYGNSPELRQTWLDSMVSLHLKYGNYSEAAHCCIHIAGLVAEYLKIKGKYPAGCAAFRNLSPNVELEEGNIKEDQETSDEQTFTERNLVALLESSISYLEQAERYEMMAEVFKLLLPFYERQRDFFHMMEMYGKLHEAFKSVVNIMTTGKRYLGTYFRVAFFGLPFGEDNEKQFIYKEPKVTALAELTLRLQKLYSRKFGSSEIVHIIKESGKVNTSALDQEHAYIQITHVVPYFESEELERRKTKFERENKISKFVYETPFTRNGRTHGDVTKQCMRKTLLTTTHWFPYVKKRIQVIHQEQFELSAIEVAIEALEKKTSDMASVVNMDPPDLKRLQLLLQGSISAQVNQGVQEYTVFLMEPHCSAREFSSHVERLGEAYRYFMQVCQEALELNNRLISTDQFLYHDELKSKFQQMETHLAPLLKPGKEESRAQSPIHAETFPKSRRGTSTVDPQRMSAILFHSISGSK